MFFWRHHSPRCRKLRSLTRKFTISGFKLRPSRLSNSKKSKSFHLGKARRAFTRVAMSDNFPLSSAQNEHEIVQTTSIGAIQAKDHYKNDDSDELIPKYPSKSLLPRHDASDSDSSEASQSTNLISEPEHSNPRKSINSRNRQLSKDDSTDLDPYDLRRRFISKQVSHHTPCLPLSCTECGTDIRR